ncbi:hypothetical protein CMI48_01195 [Candidatus Pacearchaeota archaeon]|nr:hypothetical protein [Candidatus Pacearchaeota archaeon]
MCKEQTISESLEALAVEIARDARKKELKPIQEEIEPALPHIQIEKKIGARIYQVRNTETGDSLAMKLPDARIPGWREQFKMEARYQAQAASQGTHVAPVISWNENPALILMHLYEEDLERDRVINLAGETHLFAQAAQAVEQTHRAEIMHCDIKPGNLMLNAEGDIALIDFGIAKESGKREERLGSPYYVAPETSTQGINNERSDIYNLGCTLYRILTGFPSYLGKDTKEVANAHTENPTPRARTLRPSCPETLDAVIYRAMQKNPEDRHQTATELREDLETALH